MMDLFWLVGRSSGMEGGGREGDLTFLLSWVAWFGVRGGEGLCRSYRYNTAHAH